MPTDAYAHTRADSTADTTTCADTYANANTISNAVTVADEVRRELEAHDNQAWCLHFLAVQASISSDSLAVLLEKPSPYLSFGANHSPQVQVTPSADFELVLEDPQIQQDQEWLPADFLSVRHP